MRQRRAGHSQHDQAEQHAEGTPIEEADLRRAERAEGLGQSALHHIATGLHQRGHQREDHPEPRLDHHQLRVPAKRNRFYPHAGNEGLALTPGPGSA